MSCTNGKHEMAAMNGSVILMARLVDGAGVSVRQAAVSAIEYSICELDPCWPNSLTIVDGYRAVALPAASVFFDSLQTGGLWTLDDVGYNFRHEINLGRNESFPEKCMLYEVRYKVTPTSGQKTIVRLRIRC